MIAMAKLRKCDCGQRAVYIRPWEGRPYCKNCFIRQIEKQFKRTIRKNQLLKPGEHIAVALSAGKDSTALLYMLNDLAKSMRLKLTAITADEGIKGYRPAAIKTAKAVCKKLGVSLHIVTFKKEFGTELDRIPENLVKDTPWCSWCGVLRRRVLNNEARRLGCTKLAVGHNLDDEVQAVLMGIIRGDFGQFSRLGRTTASNPNWVPRIKPLREIPEKEMALYSILRGLDISKTVCPHAPKYFDKNLEMHAKGNLILRRRVGLFLNDLEKAHPGVKHQILRFYEKLQPKISSGDTVEVGNCASCGEPSSREKCVVCSMLETLKNNKR